MKNYYDELEISKTASKEVIERVYKVLAKKYHPDTTQEEDKQAAEEKFKIISEAYEILSDDEKRKKYDEELEMSNPTISYEEYMNVVDQRDTLNNRINELKNNFNQYGSSNNTSNQQYSNNQYQTNTTYNTSKKHKYYYKDTGRPASAFAYYKYKIKEFFTNVFIFIGLIFIIISIITNLFS